VLKKTVSSCCQTVHCGWYDQRKKLVRDLSNGDAQIYLEFEMRRVKCKKCNNVVQEELEWLSRSPFHTKRFGLKVGEQCRNTAIQVVAKEHKLRWETVKELDKQYMEAQLAAVPKAAAKVIGIDEISISRGHEYRVVVSDLERRVAIWIGGKDRSEESLDEFYQQIPIKDREQVRLAVMDMWKAFRNSTTKNAPNAAILFDKFHVIRHLNEALDKIRKSEYARLTGKNRKFIKGQKYTLLSNQENLTTAGRKSLKLLLAANKRLNTAYVLKESFGQLWNYKSEAWARKFFENWRDSLKWQKLKPFEKFAEMIDRH
jgi:transposase